MPQAPKAPPARATKSRRIIERIELVAFTMISFLFALTVPVRRNQVLE